MGFKTFWNLLANTLFNARLASTSRSSLCLSGTYRSGSGVALRIHKHIRKMPGPQQLYNSRTNKDWSCQDLTMLKKGAVNISVSEIRRIVGIKLRFLYSLYQLIIH